MRKSKENLMELEEKWEMIEQYLIESRYALRDENGEPLEHNYNDVLNRISNHLDYLETTDDKPSKFFDIELIKEALYNRYIIPATPCLISFGNNLTRRKGYFSCFPLGKVPDDMEGINEWCYKMESIYKCGGGAGIDVSSLRKKGSPVDGGQGVASGPCGFLPRFDAITSTTNQGGRRRGALLVQLDWNHPDIVDFINSKYVASKVAHFLSTLPPEIKPHQNPILSNMNISVNVDDDFFKNEELLNLIVNNMWETGDPGLLFINNMIKNSPFIEEARFSNPCGEYLSPENLACNLITINVAKLANESIENPDLDNYKFNNDKFLSEIQKYSNIACRFGNFLVTLNEGYPVEEIRIQTQKFRPVGVGMSGFHTALILYSKAELPYGSEEACKFAKMVQANLTYGTLMASADLSFAYDISYNGNIDYWKTHLNKLEKQNLDVSYLRKCIKKYGGFYNCITTSQPPTGSVSQLLRNVDTGIEPFYHYEITRRVRDFETGWKEFILYPEFLSIFLSDQIMKEKLELQTSMNISPKSQLQMLSAFQEYIHTGVSKTVNVPFETSKEQMKELLMEASKLKLKGFTIFRDKCREGVINQPVVQEKYENKDKLALSPIRQGTIFEVSGPVTAYVTVSRDKLSRPREVFVQVGPAGTMLHSMLSAFGRVISVALRENPALIDRFIHTLKCIESSELYNCIDDSMQLHLRSNSLPAILSQIFEYMKGDIVNDEASLGDICPNCGKLSLFRKGGCKNCDFCGFTNC